MLLHVLIIVLMIILKAIFSAGDTALTYVDRVKLASRPKKDIKAKRINILKNNRIGFWGEIELVILMVELIATAYVAEFFVDPVAEIFNPLILEGKMSVEAADLLAVIIIGFVMAYLFLVFGHILPKQIARNNPDKTAYKTVNILWYMSFLNRPFEKFVGITTKVFSKIFRIPENTEYKLTEKELKMLIRESMSDGIIGREEKTIILNTIKFDAIQVKDEMVSKEKVESLSLKAGHDEIVQKIRDCKYSRLPVYNENPENIIGFFNMKDIVTENKIKEEIDLKNYLRELIKVHRKDSLSTTFKAMQNAHQMMAIVYDETEKYVGIITLEDIIERLVGEIIDDNDTK